MASNTRRREAFDVYWGLGRDRSIVRLQAALQARGWRLSLRTLYGWSSRDAWQAQIAERERQARVAADEEAIAERREMYKRQASTGVLLQGTGLKMLETIPPTRYSATIALRTVVEGAKLERLARVALAPPDSPDEPSV